jgi:haloalkane dehalogenase
VSGEDLTPAQQAMDAHDWTFGGTWPYEPRWLFAEGVRIHYVDEGPRDGLPVVMLHGNPTWSYLYRHLIAALAGSGFRAVAFDSVGFGRSDKPQRASEYSLLSHVRHFQALMRLLSLRQATLVLHDWGGPVGLAWAVDHASKVSGLVLTNTFTGSVLERTRLPLALRVARARGTGDLLIKGANAAVRYGLLKHGLTHLDRLGTNERTAYLAPHPSWESRTGVLAATRLIEEDGHGPTAEIATRIEAGLPGLHGTPTALCWGLRDPLARPTLELMQRLLPEAEVSEMDDAGHTVPEDAPEALEQSVRRVLERTVAAAPRLSDQRVGCAT